MHPYLYSLGSLLLGAVLLWCWSLRTNKVSHVDIFWGPAIALGGLMPTLQGQPNSVALLACGLISAWALRLATHLTIRNYGEPEDRRYLAIRRNYSAFRFQSLYVIFLLQAGLAWIVALPVQSAALAASPSHTPVSLLTLGLVLYAIGMFFEVVGDWQLATFLADTRNKGKVLDTGLWKYTRHPNYFGDFCVHWGIASICLAAGASYFTLVAPLLMTWLLRSISGAALLEKTIGTRRPEYDRYVERTSVFFPCPPKTGVKNQ